MQINFFSSCGEDGIANYGARTAETRQPSKIVLVAGNSAKAVSNKCCKVEH